MFKALRVFILLVIFLLVALSSWRTTTRLASWNDTLQIALYPINADQRPATQKYIESLTPGDFAAMGKYFGDEAKRHGLTMLYPVRVTLAPPVSALPPPIPHGGQALEILWWSLSMRYWAWRHSTNAGIRPDIRVFLLYHDPAITTKLQDSTGLDKARIGIANLFAERQMHGSNLVVTTHETLHTLGATDKYDRQTNLPIFPAGYGDPAQDPLYPQEHAELMAGRIAIDATRADIPQSLAQTRIGPETAAEIGWIKKQKP